MVYELDVDGVPTYLQLVDTNDEYGELVRVVPGQTGDSRPLRERLAEPEQFSAFFLASVAHRMGLVKALGETEIPDGVKSSPLKARGGIAPDGTVLNWWIIENGRERRVDELSREEAGYPLAEIVNAEALRERVRSGWRQTDPVMPRAPTTPSGSDERTGGDPKRTHFIYFDDASDASAAAAELAQFGVVATEKSASDPEQVLVRVVQAAEGNDEAIIEVAARMHGDYDGTEVSI